MALNHLRNLVEIFNSEVALVNGWCRANYHVLNPSKSINVMVHRDRKKVPTLPFSLLIGGQEVEIVTVVK